MGKFILLQKLSIRTFSYHNVSGYIVNIISLKNIYVFRHTANFLKVRTLKNLNIFPGFENFEIRIQIILGQCEMLERGLYHDEMGIYANQNVDH